jgi:hypothetical protein
MQTIDLRPGEELVIGGVRLTVLDIEGDQVLFCLADEDSGREEALHACAEAC